MYKEPDGAETPHSQMIQSDRVDYLLTVGVITIWLQWCHDI